MRRQILNNVNTGINFSSADNEANSQAPSLSSSKVEHKEEESTKRKESISGNHIVGGQMLCPKCLSAFH